MRASVRLLVLIGLGIVWTASSGLPAAGAFIGLTEVDVVNMKYYLNGVAQPDYWYNLSVQGTGLTSVTVSGPAGHNFTMTQQDATNWYANPTNWFGSAAAMRAAFPLGDYVFDFNSGEASLTVHFAGTEPSAVLAGLSPAHNATSVSRIPTFSWSATPTSNGVVLGTEIDNIAAGTKVAAQAPLAIGTTSWASPLMLNSTTHYAFIGTVYQGTVGSGTIEGTTFPIHSLYGYMNEVDFTTGTTPEPATLALLAAGGVGIWMGRRRKR